MSRTRTNLSAPDMVLLHEHSTSWQAEPIIMTAMVTLLVITSIKITKPAMISLIIPNMGCRPVKKNKNPFFYRHLKKNVVLE